MDSSCHPVHDVQEIAELHAHNIWICGGTFNMVGSYDSLQTGVLYHVTDLLMTGWNALHPPILICLSRPRICCPLALKTLGTRASSTSLMTAYFKFSIPVLNWSILSQPLRKFRLLIALIHDGLIHE